MRTYQITEKELEQYKKVGEGYKVFKNDWTAKYGEYDYKNEQGEVLNTIHKIDGDIQECKWGLHFSKLPQDCFNFYESVQWNRFARVEAYDKIEDSETKSATNILKIVEIYSFEDFIKLIQNRNDDSTYGISDSIGVHAVRGGNEIKGGSFISGGNDIIGGNEIKGGSDIYGGSSICGGSNIIGGNDIYGGNEIRGGTGICGGNDVYGGNNIHGVNDIVSGSDIWGGNEIKGGSYIYGGDAIIGGSNVKGGYYVWGATDCEGISKCIFCYNFTGKLHLFNKPITEERFNTVYRELCSFDWYPKFNNAIQLRGYLAWNRVDIPSIARIEPETAWSFMPKGMEVYIKSLPEYDEEVFNKVTCR